MFSGRPRRAAPLLAILLAASIALPLVVGSPHPAAAADLIPASYGMIANRALAALAQKGGECFPWMRQVVFEATGRMVGVDYRLGYLQAGAVEVPLADARNGDIIQLINDAKSDPAADYPGMHTAIVLESQGGGKFKVIDSNFRLDHIVRVHEDYDPKAHAALRPNIAVHVYRMPFGGAPGLITTSPVPANTASTAEVAADGDCLRLRATASLNAAVLGCLPTGLRVAVLPERVEADGMGWRRITGAGLTGWAADRYLRLAGAPAAVAPPPPPSNIGKIVGGSVPASGIGLIVWGGGDTDQLAAAIGCRETGSIWSMADDRMLQLVPGARLGLVNQAWHLAFPDGIPPNTALLVRCS